MSYRFECDRCRCYDKKPSLSIVYKDGPLSLGHATGRVIKSLELCDACHTAFYAWMDAKHRARDAT